MLRFNFFVSFCSAKQAEDNAQNEEKMSQRVSEDDDEAEEGKRSKNEDEDEDEDDDDDVAAPPPEGIYDPGDYEDLNVTSDIKELFTEILR